MRLLAFALLAPTTYAQSLDAVEVVEPGPVFEVSFDAAARETAFTGRVLVFLSKTDTEPRTWSNWARLEPVLGLDVEDLEPGEVARLDAQGALSFPVPLPDLEGGHYFAQAVLDLDPTRPEPGTAPGNPHSAVVEFDLHQSAPARVVLRCDRVVPPVRIRESRYAKLFEVESELLSVFHRRPVVLRALVHLPEAWFAEPERRFPVHAFLSGFGASIEGFEFVDWPAPPMAGVSALAVYPDPSCANGHSGFADSDNNGPWGSAFVEELLPAIEREFRGLGQRDARFLAGHSSGGWAALWLMVNYPDAFGWAWASSPDPVDFRDFMGVDLYRPDANLFFDEGGALRPFCRLGNIWTIGYTKEYSDREVVLRGGVLRYFEALFGPRAASGEPEPLWDRSTGALRPEIARAWSRYDIGRILRERWEELGPKLDGRVSITMGDRDNFLLQGAVALLERDLARLDADVEIDLVAGDHFSAGSYEHRLRESEVLASYYEAWAQEEESRRARR